ncbi:hypothetical protein [Streptomyces chiangmaiensis]|uniref:Uncharacterized protein n=1 Tax=Streptomyces chiangmaiensis TaxID=766497 RepID=A0ABU7FLC0_9ACTN|nr:hypothetical protein [Streptomyces chiangmaiensis]MED7824633.1 hypothetical protein [Streptomyces chiangmaiensis]
METSAVLDTKMISPTGVEYGASRGAARLDGLRAKAVPHGFENGRLIERPEVA